MLLWRKPATTQGTICVGKSRGWCRGGHVGQVKVHISLIYIDTVFFLRYFPLSKIGLGFHHFVTGNLVWFEWTIFQETTMSNAWYEVLSVLHLMAMLSLSQANLLLLPRTSTDGHQPKVSEGRYYCMRLSHMQFNHVIFHFIISFVILMLLVMPMIKVELLKLSPISSDLYSFEVFSLLRIF